MKRLAATLSALALGLAPWTALGQTTEARALAGLKSFDLVVEDVDDDAARCGITEAALETTLRGVLGHSKMQVTSANTHGDTYVYLVVTVLESCASLAELSVETGVVISRTKREATATVWKQGVVRSGGDVVHDIMANVQGLAEWLVRDWNSVNDSI